MPHGEWRWYNKEAWWHFPQLSFDSTFSNGIHRLQGLCLAQLSTYYDPLYSPSSSHGSSLKPHNIVVTIVFSIVFLIIPSISQDNDFLLHFSLVLFLSAFLPCLGGASETSEMGNYAPCLVHPRDRGLNGCRKQDFTKAKCSQKCRSGTGP